MAFQRAEQGPTDTAPARSCCLDPDESATSSDSVATPGPSGTASQTVAGCCMGSRDAEVAAAAAGSSEVYSGMRSSIDSAGPHQKRAEVTLQTRTAAAVVAAVVGKGTLTEALTVVAIVEDLVWAPAAASVSASATLAAAVVVAVVAAVWPVGAAER